MEIIFDIGFCNGFDTAFYLKNGFKVVAVDANPTLIDTAKKQFSSYIESKQLILLNKGIADVESTKEFFVSKNHEWSSFNIQIANRTQFLQNSIIISTTTLPILFKEYGIPYYCKIDIEGADSMALKSMLNLISLPKYISVETECIDENGLISDEEIFLTLDLLHQLGYNQFKLVEQNTLTPLILNQSFFPINLNSFSQKLWRKVANIEFPYLSFIHKFNFKRGSSGPFGEEVKGVWYDYEQAKVLLMEKREEYFSNKNAIKYGFWCDWHATQK